MKSIYVLVQYYCVMLNILYNDEKGVLFGWTSDGRTKQDEGVYKAYIYIYIEKKTVAK